MRIKKLMVILFVMVMPYMVNATSCDTSKVTISSIEVDNKSNNVVELSEPTANGKNVNLDLYMVSKGDNIQYRIIVKNDSEEDFQVDSNSLGLKSDYITYTIDSGADSVVKANSTKTILLRVEYKNQVPANAFKSGKYVDSNDMVVNLSSDKVISVNPNTGVNYLFCIMMIVILGVTTYVSIKKKKTGLVAILIISIIALPASVYALCKCEIKVNSNVEIQQTNFTGVIYRNSETSVYPGDSILPRDGWIFTNPTSEYEANLEFLTKEECENASDIHKKGDKKAASIPETRECKKVKIGIGDYTTNARDLNQNYYIRDEVVNDIVTKVQVCFMTTKEVCLNPNDYQNNSNTLQSENSWFESNNGSCYFSSDDQFSDCEGGGIRVSVDGNNAGAGINISNCCIPYYCRYGDLFFDQA